MSNTASPNTQKNRTSIIDSTGWTQVRKGARRQKDRRSVSMDLTSLAPTIIPDGLTLDQVEKKMHNYMKIWKVSECHGRIDRILERMILQEPTMPVSQCIALGLGSFTGGPSMEASMWEFIALQTVLETLEKRHNIKHVYLQDPCFNRLDTEMLSSLGYTVLQTPEAFEKMSNTTFLYAPRMETQFIATALDQATPSLYIGNDLSMWVHGSFIHLDKMTSKQSKTCEDFLNERTSVQLPEFDRDNWCLSQKIYWRTSDDD